MSLIPLLVIAYIFMVLVMAAAWIFQRHTNNGGWSDVFWTFGTGAASALVALAPVPDSPSATPRQIIVASLVALWSLRLGLHILERVIRSKEDARYQSLRKEWGDTFDVRMFRFLQTQAPAALILCLAVAVAARAPAPSLRLQDLFGFFVLIAAIFGESLADLQLRRFKTDPNNNGIVCDRGLWSWSRHPNYFFEWLGWLAYPVIAIDLSGRYVSGWLALSAPALMYYLLRYVSGVPPLEAAILKSKGDSFRDYQRRTNVFFPAPPRGPT